MNRAKEPERSLTLRLVILAAMLVPLVAIARVSLLWPHALVAAGGMGLGHWYSYRHLDKGGRWVRGLMFVLIHVALLWLLVGLVIGAAVPQAQFAIFTQALTSFDLRYRRSLFNTLLHSLANLYVAASLSRTFELSIYLILFAALGLAAFFVAEKEDGLKSARLRPQVTPSAKRSLRLIPARGPMMLFSLSFGAVALLAVVVAFIFTPRFANNPIVPPFTINAPLRGGIKAEIINPGVPLVQVNGWSNETGDYFYGFDTNLDLRYRGGLSDEIVMYVRSPSRSYWRSHSYDFYTGFSWEQSDKSLTEIDQREAGVHYQLSPPLGSPKSGRAGQRPGESDRIVQSFTIVREQPNLVFAAYRPAELFIVAERISLDSGDGIRLPDLLQPGFTYSVISYRPQFDPNLLRQDTGPYPAEITRPYLQLPGNISNRTRQLAQTLTEPYDNPYDKVMALNNHLLAEYPYNFFPPPHPPGAEVVDTFLFEDQEGVCEQYVTALVVMARSLGIPARLATGYGAGRYNPITNYYEVRYRDAHSWAELYFPASGWVPFDPTPGWTPQPYPTPVQNWLFANQGRFFGVELPTARIASLASGGLAGLLFFLPFLIGSALLVGLGLLVIYLVKRFGFSPPTRKVKGYTPLAVDPQRKIILRLYHQALNLLTARKHHPRESWETPAEYAYRVGRLPALARLTQATEIAAYRPETPEPETVTQAREALQTLRDKLSNKRPPAVDQ